MDISKLKSKTIVLVIAISILVAIVFSTILFVFSLEGDIIDGHIYDKETGKPLSNCYVRLDCYADLSRHLMGKTRTDSDGYFKFSNINEKLNDKEIVEYDIEFFSILANDDFYFKKYKSVNDFGEYDLYLDAGGYLQGRINLTSEESGSEFFICCNGENSTTAEILTVDSNGNFKSNLLYPGEYQININSRFYSQTPWETITIIGRETQIVRLESPKSRSNISLFINATSEVPIIIFKDNEIIGGGFSKDYSLNISLSDIGQHKLIVHKDELASFYRGEMDIEIFYGNNYYDFKIDYVKEN